MPDRRLGDYQAIVSAQRKWLIKGSFLLQFFLDKMKRIYRPMSTLVRKGQEKHFFRMETEINCYGTVKRQAGAVVSRFEVSSLEGFLFRSQQLFIHA